MPVSRICRIRGYQLKKFEVFATEEYTIAGSVREYVEVAKIEKYKRGNAQVSN